MRAVALRNGKRCLQRAFSLFTFIVVLPVLKAIKETVSLQKGKKTPVFLKRVQAQRTEEKDDSDQLTAQ